MTSIAHALVAGAIAAKFNDPFTASLLALSSHFIMDAVPHWDIGTSWRNRSKELTGALAIGETIIGIVIGLWAFGQVAPTATLILAIFFSLLPDWLETPWYIFFASTKHLEPAPRASAFEKLCYRIYKMENFFHTKAQFPMGLITQVATVIFFLVLLG